LAEAYPAREETDEAAAYPADEMDEAAAWPAEVTDAPES
jgi:hypothetical protein